MRTSLHPTPSGRFFHGNFFTFSAPAMAVRAATRAGASKVTQAIQARAADRGVRVQALCPGVARSDITFSDWSILDEVVMDAEAHSACSLAALKLGEIMRVPTLDDATLLGRVAEFIEIIRERSPGSGTPAQRYGVEPGAM